MSLPGWSPSPSEAHCSQGRFLMAEKKASVTPAFETGKKNNLGNYKPDSYTSVPGKVEKQILQPFPNTWRTRRQVGTASTDLPRANHAENPDCLP